MHQEEIMSTFLKNAEDKKWKDRNKFILMYQGKTRRHFLKNGEKKKWKDEYKIKNSILRVFSRAKI